MFFCLRFRSRIYGLGFSAFLLRVPGLRPLTGTQQKSRLDAVASGFVKGLPGGDVGLELLERLQRF